MGQDTQVCAKCGKLCGHDDRKAYWPEPGKAICGQCKDNLGRRLCAFLGLDGVSSGNMGLEIEWSDVDKILSHIQRDSAMRASYLVTDKEIYMKTIDIVQPVEQS